MINVENQLRSYRHHKEAIAMIQSQLDQLENGKIKISKITDEIFEQAKVGTKVLVHK